MTFQKNKYLVIRKVISRPLAKFITQYFLLKRKVTRRLFDEPRLDYYIQRRPTHLFKLAMLYSAARGNTQLIDKDDVVQAIQTLEQAEQKMPQVFAGVGGNPLAGLQIRILRIVKEQERIPMTELADMFFNDANHLQLGEAIATLESMGRVAMDVANNKLIYVGK